MTLMKDGLWGIVNGPERDPGESEVQVHKNRVYTRPCIYSDRCFSRGAIIALFDR